MNPTDKSYTDAGKYISPSMGYFDPKKETSLTLSRVFSNLCSKITVTCRQIATRILEGKWVNDNVYKDKLMNDIDGLDGKVKYLGALLKEINSTEDKSLNVEETKTNITEWVTSVKEMKGALETLKSTGRKHRSLEKLLNRLESDVFELQKLNKIHSQKEKIPSAHHAQVQTQKELAQAKEQVTKAQAEVAESKQKLTNSEELVAELTQKLTELSEEKEAKVQELQAKLNVAETKVEKHKGKHGGAKNEIETLKKQLEQAKTEANALRSEIEARPNPVENLESKWKEDLDKTKASLTDAQKEISQLKETQANLRLREHSLEQTIREGKKISPVAHAEVIAKLEDAEAAKAELEEHLAFLETKMKALENPTEENLAFAANQTNEEIENLKNELQKLRASKEIDKKTDSQSWKMAEDKITSLEAQIDELQKDKIKLEAFNKDLIAKGASSMLDAYAKNPRETTLTENMFPSENLKFYTNLGKHILAKEAEIQELKNHLSERNELIASQDFVVSETITKAQEEVNLLKANITALENEKTELIAEKDNLQAKLDQAAPLGDRVVQLKMQLSEIQGELEGMLAEKQMNSKKTEEEKKQFEDKFNQVKNQGKTLESKITQLEQKNELLKQTNAFNMSNFQKSIDAKEARVRKELGEEVSQLKEQLASAEKNKEFLKAKLETAHENLEYTQKVLDARRQAISDELKQLKLAEKGVKELRTEFTKNIEKTVMKQQQLQAKKDVEDKAALDYLKVAQKIQTTKNLSEVALGLINTLEEQNETVLPNLKQSRDFLEFVKNTLSRQGVSVHDLVEGVNFENVIQIANEVIHQVEVGFANPPHDIIEGLQQIKDQCEKLVSNDKLIEEQLLKQGGGMKKAIRLPITPDELDILLSKNDDELKRAEKRQKAETAEAQRSHQTELKNEITSKISTLLNKWDRVGFRDIKPRLDQVNNADELKHLFDDTAKIIYATSGGKDIPTDLQIEMVEIVQDIRAMKEFETTGVSSRKEIPVQSEAQFNEVVEAEKERAKAALKEATNIPKTPTPLPGSKDDFNVRPSKLKNFETAELEGRSFDLEDAKTVTLRSEFAEELKALQKQQKMETAEAQRSHQTEMAPKIQQKKQEFNKKISFKISNFISETVYKHPEGVPMGMNVLRDLEKKILQKTHNANEFRIILKEAENVLIEAYKEKGMPANLQVELIDIEKEIKKMEEFELHGLPSRKEIPVQSEAQFKQVVEAEKERAKAALKKEENLYRNTRSASKDDFNVRPSKLENLEKPEARSFDLDDAKTVKLRSEFAENLKTVPQNLKIATDMLSDHLKKLIGILQQKPRFKAALNDYKEALIQDEGSNNPIYVPSEIETFKAFMKEGFKKEKIDEQAESILETIYNLIDSGLVSTKVDTTDGEINILVDPDISELQEKTLAALDNYKNLLRKLS